MLYSAMDIGYVEGDADDAISHSVLKVDADDADHAPAFLVK